MKVDERHKDSGIIAEKGRSGWVFFPHSFECLVGADEAGRGPLAGPVAVGTVLITKNQFAQFKKWFKGYPVGKDSKLLTETERNFWFKKIKEAEEKNLLTCRVSFSSHRLIDKIGISKAVSLALEKNLKDLKIFPEESFLRLDAGLKAPAHFKNQTPLIKGDTRELVISLASVAAKVSRDKKMIKFAHRYPEYLFEKHKGYGTKEHRERLKKHGLSSLHRKTYCQSI